jgi:hypothetical protein
VRRRSGDCCGGGGGDGTDTEWLDRQFFAFHSIDIFYILECAIMMMKKRQFDDIIC